MGGSHEKLQLWGGIECTVNRVGTRYFDQLRYSGHHDRLADLDLIAGLGVRVLRYPVLWERAEAEQAAGLSWADERLARLVRARHRARSRSRASRQRPAAHVARLRAAFRKSSPPTRSKSPSATLGSRGSRP